MMEKVILLISIICFVHVHGEYGFDYDRENPPPPENVSCMAISSQAIKLAWEHPPSALSARGDYAINYKLVNNSDGEGTEYTHGNRIILIGLKSNSNYSIKMQLGVRYDEELQTSKPVFCTTHEDVIATNMQLAVSSENPGVTSALTLVVRHSLRNEAPLCPDEQGMIWSGYSLKGILSKEKDDQNWNTQDLGSVASCSQTFGYIQLVTDRDVWPERYKKATELQRTFLATASFLATADVPIPQNVSVLEQISRCAVCAVQSPVITLHSLTTEIPACPNGWSALWTGFSFLMQTGYRRSLEDISMTSTGSCLENYFNDHFGIWCDEYWDCKRSYHFSKTYWLAAAKTKPGPQLSRCVVCKFITE